jgi:hypothetical protein
MNLLAVLALLFTPPAAAEPVYSTPTMKCELTMEARARLGVPADFVGPVAVRCTR